MAYRVIDRVKEVCYTQGTGALAFSAGIPGYQRHADVLSDGDYAPICVANDAGEWETFLGQWNAGTQTMARVATIESSNGGAPVNLSGGPRQFAWINDSATRADLSPLNVKDFGAVGDGVTDDSAAFQRALDAVPADGGVVVIPPTAGGVYIVDATLRHKSYTKIVGSGAASKLKNTASFVKSSDYGGGAMWLNANSESSETAFTAYRDFGIVFENVWIDVTDNAEGAGGHSIFHRACKNVKIISCTLIGGGDATAAVTCDDHLVVGCTAIGQANCTYDHWGGSSNCRVIASLGRIASGSTGQIVNFNGIRTSVGGGTSETWVSDGFLLEGCDLYSGSTQRSVNLEPLGANSTTKNIRIVGNKFNNARLVMGGDCQNVHIGYNQFIDCDGTTSPIWSRVQTDTPALVSVIGNQFIDCDAPASEGLIDLITPSALVVGNSATGGTYDYGVNFRGTGTNVNIGNRFQDAGTADYAGTWTSSVDDLIVANNMRVGFFTTSGYVVKFRMGSDDTFRLISTGTSGAERTIWSVDADSATAALVVAVNQRMSAGYFIPYATSALTATGSGAGDALLLAHEISHVGTVSAGTGVRLPSVSNTGQRLTVVNDGANALNVYPTTGTQIDSLGVNVAFSLAAGSSGIWQYLNSKWRTISVYP